MNLIYCIEIRSIFVNQMEEIGIKLIPLSNRIKKIYYPTISKKKSKNSGTPIKSSGELRILLGGIKNLVKRIPDIIWLIIITIKYKIDIVHANHDLTGDRSNDFSINITKEKNCFPQ